MNPINSRQACEISQRQSPVFEFHITRKARDKYQFEESFFSLKGQIIFANFATTHRFANSFNEPKPDDKKTPASELNAMGLLDEIMHFIIESYRKDINPDLFNKLESFLKIQFGEIAYEKLLIEFADKFPVSEVYRMKISAEKYLTQPTEELSNKHIALEEIIVLWLDNQNPAYKPIEELIDETDLKEDTVYNHIFNKLDSFFKTEPAFGPENLPLLDLLQLPAKKYPHSLTAQLEYIKQRWSKLLEPLLARILISMDFIKEEHKARFDVGQFGPGPTYVLEFGELPEYEPEQFSADLDWMPRVVLIAKSTYVWLDQLSKQYQLNITRLDQIPDAELDRLARYGFTGLWLIGIWERSRASQRIKQIAGNPEAVASAYSLMNYNIAPDLGGDEAYQNLKDRAWKRGVRLASDMVPNHMGIDSEWVINHPDWFIQSDHPPFPTYSYNGQDLSDDSRVGIFIEDGYWSRTDAAVTFKRLDRHTGEARYIYHGNDGTSMPWNDTAQLNYLMPEVREAVIQTILHVARKFPIIRFDAAMTLAKKHYQRLWFPEPGHGGDIPSRAEHALTKDQFNKLFPVEFWREVVDRVQQEVPDTLLLAEAFWMMESYFVRSLGMHRVYNSAFMNMLKNEENDKYRLSIKNILEFNPQILKRYVNFMNNPDEETAVAQFGKDDKYFGVCVLMATMPGLPMFGHGQIEGFEEKYGMEYRRAYWDEQVNDGLVFRHELEIFPLLRKRHLFSDVENFFLYDFFRSDGSVDENVFAYSNAFGPERSFVIYHNRFTATSGWIKMSAAYIKDEKLQQVSLADGLQLSGDADKYICFKDSISNLEYIYSIGEIRNQGWYVELGTYKFHVFLEFREVRHTSERPYGELYGQLNKQGVPSIEAAMDAHIYRPVISAFYECVNPGSLEWLSKGLTDQKADKKVAATFNEKAKMLNQAVAKFEKIPRLSSSKLKRFTLLFNSSLKSVYLSQFPKLVSGKITQKALKEIDSLFNKNDDKLSRDCLVLLTLPFMQILYELYIKETTDAAFDFVNERHLLQTIVDSWTTLGFGRGEAEEDILLLKVLMDEETLLLTNKQNPVAAYFENLFEKLCVIQLLKINRYEGVVYFNKERFELLLKWLFMGTIVHLVNVTGASKKIQAKDINQVHRKISQYLSLAEKVGYDLDAFKNLVSK